jgi:hypothetical protein
MDDNTRAAKEKTFWDKFSPEYGRFIAHPMVKKAEERKEAAKLKNE